MQYEFESDDDVVIVIAPRDVSMRIARYADEVSVVAFRSVDDFERWRMTGASSACSIREDVSCALGEIGARVDALSYRLRTCVEQLSARGQVPSLEQVEQCAPSRRSFYRMWTAELSEGPGRFLRRVRVLHAERLIRDGMTQKEAAMRAGFASVDHFRRLRGQRKRTT